MNHRSIFEQTLLMGAAGDALGGRIEFSKGLQRQYPIGYRQFDGTQLFTDDTQMTLFSAEAILLTPGNDPADLMNASYAAYQRWFLTQQGNPQKYAKYPGLLAIRQLHRRMAPGTTCLSALRTGKTVENSKGCGGVMRAAPYGLQLSKSPRRCFHDAADAAWITHGHPGGYLPAGALAAIIRCLLDGLTLERACYQALRILRDWQGSESTQKMIRLALGLSDSISPKTPWQKMASWIDVIGGGWVGDEALGIALYAVLAIEKHGGTAKDVLALAVTHDGDSDSTGAVAGNIAGALGHVLPEKWEHHLELSELVKNVAGALYENSARQSYNVRDWNVKGDWR